MCVYIYTYVYTHMCTYVCIYIYIYIYTCIYTYIHLYRLSFQQPTFQQLTNIVTVCLQRVVICLLQAKL